MGVSSLALAIISFAGLTVSLFALVFGKSLRPALGSGSEWTLLLERMMLFFLAGILLLIVIGTSQRSLMPAAPPKTIR
ncbi:hypothetical protein ACC736_39835, partial [Rhizobium ruizarguesonis]